MNSADEDDWRLSFIIFSGDEDTMGLLEEGVTCQMIRTKRKSEALSHRAFIQAENKRVGE